MAVLDQCREYSGSWRHDSAGKSTCWSYRGPEFGSQHPQGGSQLSVTPIPGVFDAFIQANTHAHK